ncbi:hypothetical protein PHISCL_04145 [Aspergillus sclerotialis]|uniref:Uncharacterized protein n=1 Tax=Aspergillus sclerotialis TaxID=2070753 RepID=A0A3A3A2E6_9EURO|nr:hypothetical protein PHISCL_04145 [Aspergillus sclerotialis]
MDYSGEIKAHGGINMVVEDLQCVSLLDLLFGLSMILQSLPRRRNADNIQPYRKRQNEDEEQNEDED